MTDKTNNKYPAGATYWRTRHVLVTAKLKRKEIANAELLEALERVSKHMVQIPKYMQAAIAKAKS